MDYVVSGDETDRRWDSDCKVQKLQGHLPHLGKCWVINGP